MDLAILKADFSEEIHKKGNEHARSCAPYYLEYRLMEEGSCRLPAANRTSELVSRRDPLSL